MAELPAESSRSQLQLEATARSGDGPIDCLRKLIDNRLSFVEQKQLGNDLIDGWIPQHSHRLIIFH